MKLLQTKVKLRRSIWFLRNDVMFSLKIVDVY
jgi:hypothetical protein